MSLRNLLIAFAVCATIIGCDQKTEQTHDSDVLPGGIGTIDGKVRGVLKPGEQLLELKVAGWINGPPPEFDGQQRLIVVDLWGQWCTEVPKTITHLIGLHKKFSSKNVAFVSLTTEPRQVVESFFKTHQIPWANGYGATRKTISSLGAGNPDMGMVPGYEVKPTLYVVDGDGRVLWCDNNHSRMDHDDKDKQKLISNLEAALTKHLGTQRDESES